MKRGAKETWLRLRRGSLVREGKRGYKNVKWSRIFRIENETSQHICEYKEEKATVS